MKISITWNAIGQYAKGIAAVLGAVATSVTAANGAVPNWIPVVIAAASAVAVVLVPNAPKQ